MTAFSIFINEHLWKFSKLIYTVSRCNTTQSQMIMNILEIATSAFITTTYNPLTLISKKIVKVGFAIMIIYLKFYLLTHNYKQTLII